MVSTVQLVLLAWYNVANVPPVEAHQAQSTESFWATELFQGPITEQLSCKERTFRGRG